MCARVLEFVEPGSIQGTRVDLDMLAALALVGMGDLDAAEKALEQAWAAAHALGVRRGVLRLAQARITVASRLCRTEWEHTARDDLARVTSEIASSISDRALRGTFARQYLER